AQDVSGLVQLAEIVEAGLDVAHVPARTEVGGKGHYLSDAGRARIEVHDRVPVLRLQQIGPRLGHVLDELRVDDEGDRQRMNSEPFAVRIAEYRRQLVEVDRLERRDQVLARRIDRGSGEVVGRVRLRPVARLVERDHRRSRTDV